MPRLVHLTPESRRKAVERHGIRAERTNVVVGAGKFETLTKAVYAMPVVPSRSVTYQWVRELRRWHGERMLAVHFVVPSDELVLVGRYNQPHVAVPLREAVRLVLASPAGNEIILRRAVRAREIATVREITQLIGWTETPEPGAAFDCLCVACVAPGTRDLMRRVRAAYERHVLAARTAKSPDEARRALLRLEVPLERARGRLPPGKLLRFARAEDKELRRAAVTLLGYFRWADVESTLCPRLRDEWGAVREAAVGAIVRASGLRRAAELAASTGDELVTMSLIEHLEYASDVDVASARLAALMASARGAELRRRIVAAAEAMLRDDELAAKTKVQLEGLRDAGR